MDELLKLHKRYSEKEMNDSDLSKLDGECYAGCKIEIFWQDMEKKAADYTDEGYLFQTPYCDDDSDILDFFAHIPRPDNSSGIGDPPAVFAHLIELLINPLITKIKIS